MENRSITDKVPLQQALYAFLMGNATTAEKIDAVQTALESTDGKFWREELGKWAARMVPVELLVPEVHRDWRPLVHEAILFVVSRLSASRLAPKIVEQMTLGPEVAAEVRLLRFIAKVPGLQKIGQVLARNRHLHPRLRRALIKLENGISDVSAEEICSIIKRELQSQMETYAIRLEPTILSEASVSAVVGFTWRNPDTRRRERSVFKVLKPHISSCYAEDMRILGQLARHLARKHHVAGAKLGRLAETLTEIRLLLEREVDFPREQATIANALSEYRSLRGVRVPHLIPLLSTATITALTFERGKKITEVHVLPSKVRVDVAERLAKALLAVPALSREKDSIFHADPHAGNLLYDKRQNELVILDWALTERLTGKQRKNVVLLVLMMMLRDADGMTKAIEELCQLRAAKDRVQLRNIRDHVDRLLDELPLTQLPGPMDAMRLLDEIALEGNRFPATLLMFRKASFTLEGVVEDIAGSGVRLDSLVASHALADWKNTVASLFSLLSVRDWASVEWSALTFTSRVCAHALFRPWYWLPGFHTNAKAA
ncbi:MAG TPA: AarF/UbiB family protein [Candidatus Sulfotelmatobacter sp.]|nr:AarF/UbiB family protein [Candidatus Sulfotelmatobacter sp.]